MTHPAMLTSKALIRAAVDNPSATPMELELADRLLMALQEIDLFLAEHAALALLHGILP